MGGGVSQNFLDFHEPPFMLHHAQSHYQPIFADFAQHDNHLPISGLPSIMEKSYSTPFPFSSLAANPVGANSMQNGNTYRNSFDFLEMDSTNLLDMTGDNYQRLINQSPHQPV